MGGFVEADESGYELGQHGCRALRGNASFAFDDLVEVILQLGAELEYIVQGQDALAQAGRDAL
jgi:hypothetical protein